MTNIGITLNNVNADPNDGVKTKFVLDILSLCETNKEKTTFTPCLEAIPHVKSADGDIQTKPFLDACKLVLLVIDKFSAAMALVKADVVGNISRLNKKQDLMYLSF